MREVNSELFEVFSDCIFFDESLAQHTSFKIGGPADFFLFAKDSVTVRKALLFCCEQKIPIFILGSGSNVLIPDTGIRAMVIKIGIETIEANGNFIIAGAGALLPKISMAALENGLAGAEFCIGIPGTVGGAVVMNAGIGDEWIGKLVKKVEGFGATGNEISFEKADLSFGYRTSSLKDFNGVITKIHLRLAKGNKKEIEAKMEFYKQKRIMTQPLEYPSAGSIFKNPEGDYAGRLIEEAGCKGMKIGGAEVSDKHANFIVNRGDATCKDVKTLIQLIREKVYQKFKVDLDLEVIDVGEHIHE